MTHTTSNYLVNCDGIIFLRFARGIHAARKLSAFFWQHVTIVLEKEFRHWHLHEYIMTLDDTQRKKVAGWIAEGLKLSEIQNRLASELGVRMTYMDVRLLVDDLKLTPKDIDPPKPPAPAPAPAAPAKPGAPLKVEKTAAPENSVSGVSISVDQLTRPGSVVSGKVTFSDGVTAEWYIDQTGQLRMAASQAGYRPSAPDIQQFQILLEAELSKLGM